MAKQTHTNTANTQSTANTVQTSGADPQRAIDVSEASATNKENIIRHTPALNADDTRLLEQIIEQTRAQIAKRDAEQVSEDGRRKKQSVLPEGELVNDPDAQLNTLPQEWRTRLVPDKNKFMLRDDPSVLVFRANDKELATKLNDPKVARLLAATADERGWSNIQLKGTAAFRREVWIEATARGIQVSGYRAKEVDLNEMALRAKQFENRNRVIADKKAVMNLTPATIAARNPEQSKPAVALKTVEEYLASTGADPTTKRVIAAAMRSEMAQRDPKKIRDINMREPQGVLVSHGPAPYKFDSEMDRSYYVTLARDGQERTVWGKYLEKAMSVSRAVAGDVITLRRSGSNTVSINGAVRDKATHKVTRQQKTSQRQTWQVTVDRDRNLTSQASLAPIRGRDDDLGRVR